MSYANDDYLQINKNKDWYNMFYMSYHLALKLGHSDQTYI